MATSSQDSKVVKTLVEQFCAITGADKDVARRMLEACNGDLEMSINMHVDASEALANPVAEERMLTTSAAAPAEGEMTACDASTEANSSAGESIRAPIPPTQGVLMEEAFPFALRGRRRPPRSVFDGFRDFEAETRRQEQALWNPPDTQRQQKRKTLEDLFRPPIDLTHKGTFDSARERGQYENKWLMVNVQNVQEFSCQTLNRDVWSTQAVKSIIREHFIFFQVYHDSEEGQRYMQFYKIKEWPYVAIIDPRTGENMVVWNNLDSVAFCDLVTDFLTAHPSLDGGATQSPPKKQARTDSIVDASEDSQLEAAIKASLMESSVSAAIGRTSQRDELESDQDAVSQEDAEEEEISDIETFESDSEVSSSKPLTPSNSAKQQPQDTPKQQPKEASKQPECEPASPSCSKLNNSQTDGENSADVHKPASTNESENSQVSTSSDCPDWRKFLGDPEDTKSDLVFRFPDGRKEQLNLPASSILKALILYVDSKGFSSTKYELVTNFPRRQLSQMDSNISLKDAGLFPQETIFIQAR